MAFDARQLLDEPHHEVISAAMMRVLPSIVAIPKAENGDCRWLHGGKFPQTDEARKT
jgi:hypothetical protein